MDDRWKYDWLLSCPLMLLLGEFPRESANGVVLLSLAYPRVVVLGRGSEVRVVSRASSYSLERIVEKICIGLSRGTISVDSFVESAIYKAMFYGGYCAFLNRGGEAVPVIVELVDVSKYKFYYKRVEEREPARASLESWVLLGVALRTGYEDYLLSACREVGTAGEDGSCTLRVHGGELLITTSASPRNGYVRVVPDNSPARHVVKFGGEYKKL